MIKLTSDGTKVLTKTVNGVVRVSCSCCAAEPNCCYYPADIYGIVWNNQDLPEEIVVYFLSDLLEGPFTLSHNGNATYGTFGNLFVYMDGAGEEGGEWTVSYKQSEPGMGSCLFLDAETDPPITSEFGNNAWIFDTFEDTYTVEVYSLPQSGPPEETYTIERTSLCEWRDESGDNVLTYNARAAGSAAEMWTFQTSIRVDAGPYNSPIGEYSEGNVLWVVS
jgi:hypothetical protein